MPMRLIQGSTSQLPAMVTRHLRESVLKTEGAGVSMNDGLIPCFGAMMRQHMGRESASKTEGGGGSDLKSFSKPHLLTDLSPPSSDNLSENGLQWTVSALPHPLTHHEPSYGSSESGQGLCIRAVESTQQIDFKFLKNVF